MFLNCHIPTHSVEEYRWVIPILEGEACYNQTCGGSTHTFCKSKKEFKQIQEESGFQEIPMDDAQKLMYLLAVNGIRNKIAMDWSVSNMNRLHWSRLLQKLSERFLWKCQRTDDACDYLGTQEVTISQNRAFMKKTQIQHNSYGYAVRLWYTEFVKKESSFEEYETMYKNQGIGDIGNFTNMIWPETELMGCAAANWTNDVMVVCFFYPRTGDINKFNIGASCSDCPENRPTCSTFFLGLCGIDRRDEINGSKKINFSCWLPYLGLLIYFLKHMI